MIDGKAKGLGQGIGSPVRFRTSRDWDLLPVWWAGRTGAAEYLRIHVAGMGDAPHFAAAVTFAALTAARVACQRKYWFATSDFALTLARRFGGIRRKGAGIRYAQ